MTAKSKLLFLTATAMLLTLGGCVTAAPGAQSAGASGTASPPRVYSYPMRGQSSEQQDRDRYECYDWAVQQTGVDPTRLADGVPSPEVVVQVTAPADATIAGVAIGAAIGSTMGKHGDSGSVVVGAIIGGLLGAATSEAAQAEADVQAVQRESDARAASVAEAYRRAMAACLEGRGYSVR